MIVSATLFRGIYRDSQYTLTITDNGPAMIEQAANTSSSGFGLMMIDALTEQLNGTIRIEHDGGTRATLEFPITDNA